MSVRETVGSGDLSGRFHGCWENEIHVRLAAEQEDLTEQHVLQRDGAVVAVVDIPNSYIRPISDAGYAGKATLKNPEEASNVVERGIALPQRLY